MISKRWMGLSALVTCLGCSGAVFTAADGDAGSPDAYVPDSGSPPGDSGPPVDAMADGGGAPDSGCVTGSLEFQLDVASGSKTQYCPGASASCGEGWLSVLSEDGGQSFGLVASCEPDCSNCAMVACPAIACAIPPPVGDGGVRTTWDGTYYQAGTCGASVACENTLCAPPGHYIAKMCGYAAAADAGLGTITSCVLGTSTPTCTEVPFVWPGSPDAGTIIGQIGDAVADAGEKD